jgi:MFS family permease
MTATSTDRVPDKSRWIVLAVLTLIYGANFLDRQILSVLSEPIKKDLHLDDTQLGLLTGFMFAIFYTTFGIPVAWLADRVNRVKVIAAACAIWSVFCASCGLATGFVQLALARMGVGIGEAGGAPPSYSLLADYFPPKERGLAMGIFSFGVPIGIVLGSAFGGAVAAEHGWRAAFVAVAAPGFVLSLLALLVIRERRRGGADLNPDAAMAEAKVPLFESIALFFKSPILTLAAVSSGASGFVSYGILNWLPPLMMRDKGMTMADVAAWYSLALGAATAMGLFLGGWLADKWGRKDRRAYAWIPALAFLVGAPLFIAGLNVDDWRLSLALLMVPAGLASSWLAPMIAVVQNEAPACRRTVSSALLLFVLNLVGMGGGPFFVGRLSDYLSADLGKESLQAAMMGLVPFMGIAVLCLFALSVALKAPPQPKPE